MPRGKSATKLPGTLQRSNEHAQAIFVDTHDAAVKQYGEDGEAAHRVAFASLKHSYRKEGDRWVKKAIKGPSDRQDKRDQNTRVKSTDPKTLPTRGGAVEGMEKTKQALLATAKKLNIRGRSTMNKEELAESILKAN